MSGYTTEQVSQKLNIPVKTLEYHRSKGKGIPYVKIGGAVRYLQKDIDAFLTANSQEHEEYVRPVTQAPTRKATSRPGRAERETGKEQRTAGDWKAQVLDVMLANGIISKRFTGRITLDIENGSLKTTLKQEEL